MPRRNGLSKYDAPLKIQFSKGYNAFKRGKLNCPYHPNTMQAREWQRGFNKAYFDNLERVLQREEYRRAA